MSSLRSWLLGTTIFTLLTACAQTPVSSDATLYQQLGGEAVMTAVVSETVDAMIADPEVNQSFEQVRLPRLKKSIHSFICWAAQGPCAYKGDPIKIVHANLGIREKEFITLVQYLRDALDRHHVPEGAKNELLRRLAPLKRDIVTA